MAGATVLIARNAFNHDMSWMIAALPSARSQRELLTNDGASEEIQEKEDIAMTTVPVHCSYSLYALNHCITLY